MNEHPHRIPAALILGLFAVAFACVFLFIKEYGTVQKEIAAYTEIQSDYTRTHCSEPITQDGQQAETLPYVAADFNALREVNPDTIGWVSIPNTAVSYPVMQYADNNRYLRRDSAGNKSSAGAAFMDCKNTVQPLDRNTVIYAHNMGAGRQDEMFGPLLQYKEREHYQKNRMIQFDTYLENHGWWEVFAVIHLNTADSGFNYLQQVFKNDDDFMTWLEHARGLSLYETSAEVTADDIVLTLSTCDRSEYGRSGRFIVLAVKCDTEKGKALA